jgi:hypothetical protein
MFDGPQTITQNLKLILTGKNPVLNYLHESATFKSVGLRICPRKSGFVRIYGL